MNRMHMHNPFLTSEVEQACSRARVAYLDALARLQQNGGQPVAWLEAVKQQCETNLDHAWDAARKLAFAGHVDGASDQLSSLVMEWGVYKAFADLIDGHELGRYLDPADPDTSNDIQVAIEHKVAYLAAELLNELLAGDSQRQAEHAHQQRDWQQVAFQQVQQQMVHQANWHEAALGTFQEQRASWHEAQAVNQQYAQTALDGVHQAQQSVQSMYQGAQQLFDYAAATQAHVVGMHQSLQSQLDQRLPAFVGEAAPSVERRRGLTRAIGAALFILAIPVACVLAYVILTSVLR